MSQSEPASAAPMDEFALIQRFFNWPAEWATDALSLGIGDDCALLQPPPDQQLAISTDTLIAGRHFPFATRAYDIGWKALAVNVSDLAAMGAQPLAFLLALSLPQADPHWLESFASGMRDLARLHRTSLIGGDTTRGALSVTITVIGCVPAGAALLRSGAQPGDCICVTGTLGDAALALRLLTSGDACDDFLTERLNRPAPRVAAGLALRGLAHAAIDLSDGLAGDLSHVLEASGVGADIDRDALPMSTAFARCVPEGQRFALQAAGGDDYELCVCIAPDQLDAARQKLREADELPLTCIGRVSAARGLRWRDAAGLEVAADLNAYRHFH